MGGTPKWMVYKFTKLMENPIEMDDLVAPPFMETPKLQTWIIPWIIGITGASLVHHPQIAFAALGLVSAENVFD